VAFWGGGMIRRYAPDGALDREVAVPAKQTTSCAFAGPELDQLVITTAATGDEAGVPGAGQTYLHQPAGITGRPVDRFAG
jgi:sugar lactone lactonase YvrE